MKKQSRLWLLGLVVLAAGLAALYLYVPAVRFRVMGLLRGESFHEGRPTSVWIENLKTGKDKDREEAAETLSRVKPSPELVKALAVALQDSNPIVRRNAATSLKELGEAASPVAEDLIAALADDEVQVRREVARTLGMIKGDPKLILPALMDTIQKDRDAATRVMAMSSLRGFGDASHIAIPILMEITKESGGNMYANPGDSARRTLATFGSAAFPALLKALGHENAKVRTAAAALIPGVGLQAKEALPDLRKLLKDSDPAVQIMAAQAVWTIDRQSKETLPVFLDGLKSKDFNTLITAIKAIGEMGPTGADAVPTLTRMLKNDISFVRKVAATSLGQIGEPAKGAIPSLEAILEDIDQEVREEATTALKKLKTTS
jgi:HEAT repeat protein